MSAHILLNLWNSQPSILSRFGNECNKFNNTGAQMLDSSYHTILKLHGHCIYGVKKSYEFTIMYARLSLHNFKNIKQ